MSVEDLAQEIARAGGKVFIGFKDSSAVEAIDEHGVVLTSRSVVEAMAKTLRDRGVIVKRVLSVIPAVDATVNADDVAKLLANPYIEYIEPHAVGRLIPATRASPSDVAQSLLSSGGAFPKRGSGVRRFQGANASLVASDTGWNIKTVRADSAWQLTTGSGVKLLVLDDGTHTHPDLDYEHITACGQANATHAQAHGTRVAGVAAALANAEYIVGVAPQVLLYSMSVVEGLLVPEANFICGLEYADSVGIDVINMSLEFLGSTATTTGMLNALYSAGVVLVGASGNEGTSESVVYPAKLASVIAVGAVTSNNSLWSTPNNGSHTGPELEFVAPGAIVTSLWNNGQNTTEAASGTSLAAPHVAGAAALLRAYNSSWTPAEIRRRLALSALDLDASGRDNSFGYGLINILGALQLTALNPATIEIDGPTLVKPFATCTWTASVSGGVAPFTFTSYPTFSPSHFLTYQNGSNHGEQFTIVFQATGADWAVGSGALTVNVSSSAPECPW